MFISFEPITGVGLGIEWIGKDTLEEGKGWYLIIELLILRIIIDK